MPLYCGVDGAKRKITKLPVGENGVKRYLSEKFAGIDGAMRKIFSASIPIGTVITITENLTWECPATGRWLLELHGGGGGGGTAQWLWEEGGGGGGSGDQQEITLTKGDLIPCVIGPGGHGSTYNSPGGDGEPTSFGEYSLPGGKGGTKNSPGSGSGNIASGGSGSTPGEGNINNPGQTYGDGGVGADTSHRGKEGQPGAIILTYLGG